MRAPPARPCRVAGLAAAALLVACLTACGGKGSQTTTTSVLESRARSVTYGQVRQSVIRLYRDHPDIKSFVSRQVQYAPKTRDKVLRVCRRGGPKAAPGELETSRVFACAPLIFFFYNYGLQSSVADSVEVARKLYWYAVTHNRRPYESSPVLTSLLRRWGIK